MAARATRDGRSLIHVPGGATRGAMVTDVIVVEEEEEEEEEAWGGGGVRSTKEESSL